MCFFLFIGFNYAFHGSGGLKETLWDSANQTMSGERLTQWNEWMPKLSQGFGIACVMCFMLAIVFFIVEAFHRPPEAGSY